MLAALTAAPSSISTLITSTEAPLSHAMVRGVSPFYIISPSQAINMYTCIYICAYTYIESSQGKQHIVAYDSAKVEENQGSYYKARHTHTAVITLCMHRIFTQGSPLHC